ncbi:MAG TPA: diaminopimelate decarboxylase, partial [Candidatus Limnocylindria bacterium]
MTAAAPAELLAEAATRWGTPLYVTDLDTAAERLADWQAAFPDSLIAYAVKANPDPQLLRRLVTDGAGCEVVSAVELALAHRAGCPPERIVMNGVGKRDEELHLALGAGVLINAESLDELDRLLALARDHADARIGLRLNPEIDAGAHEHLATGAADSKFGIPLDALPAALDRLDRAGIGLASLGAHIGSDISNALVFAALAIRLAEAAEAALDAGLDPGRIDLGGGLANVDGPILTGLSDAVRAILPNAALTWEPGRSIVADAGWLVTRVVRTQPRPAAGCG